MSLSRWKKWISMLLILPAISLMSVRLVKADDDDERSDYREEEDDYHEEEDDDISPVPAPIPTPVSPAPTPTPSPTQSTSSSKPKTITTKEYIPAQYTTVTEAVTLKDSDLDGIPDERDPHPNISEQIIVTDNNANGVVDYFETLADSSQGNNSLQVKPVSASQPAPTTTTKKS